MMYARAGLLTILLLLLPKLVFAFDMCSMVFAQPDALSQHIKENATRRAPAKYHDLANEIMVVTEAPDDSLIPFATELQGTKLVVLSPRFAEVVCKFALATFLTIEGSQVNTLDQAAEAAARCLDAGGLYGDCVVGFANRLAEAYDSAFRALPDEVQVSAYNLYRSALNQVIMHEYAHHFLDHAARLRDQQLSRIDAEFEADLFAILNGIQAAETPTAMYYFFDALARMERYNNLLLTDDYESGSCRQGNVTNVSAFLGLVPMVLLDAAFGGGYVFQRNSPSTVSSTVQEHFGGAPPALDPGSCGRIAQWALNDAFEELRALALRMEPEAEFLLAKGEEVDTARARDLIGDLAQMATTFRYMNGVTTKSIALMLRRWGLEGRDLSPLIAEAGRVVDAAAVTDEFLSEDFGRLLQAQGLAMLQERVDLAPELRLAHAYSLLREAVAYNPALSEAWVNLAFVALKHGDCATAAEFAEQATNTATDEEQREHAKFFAGKMREMARDPELCRQDGAGFHQGL